MKVQEAIQIIKEQISQCKQDGEIFVLPKIENTKVEINDLPNEGADLLHQEYKINT